MTNTPGRHAATAADRGGRTNWKRFAILAVPAAAAVGFMFAGVAQGAIGANVVISGAEAKISASTMDGQGFVQYGAIDQWADKSKFTVVTTAAMKNVDLANMCQSVVVPIPIIGNYTLKINAGGNGTPAHADTIFIDLTHLEGDATFTNIEIGNDSFAGLNKGPIKNPGFQGMFGQQADKIHVDGLRQNMYFTSANSFHLSGLKMDLAKGSGANVECY